MKKIILISIVLVASFVSNAQTGTSRAEPYCEVIATPRPSNRLSVEIIFKNSILQSELKD